MMFDISVGQFEHRLLLAFTLGAVIGFERQWRHKLAGVKTNALVAGGAALFVLMAEKIHGDSSGTARIAAQIVTGIGFLGAGVIIREGYNITGLNTSATIWCSGAVGALAGMGFWYEASVGTAFVILAHLILRPISDRLDKRLEQIEQSGYKYLLRLQCSTSNTADIKIALIEAVKQIPTLHISSIKIDEGNRVLAEIRSLDKRQTDIENIVNELSLLNEVTSVKWEDVKK